MQKYCVQWNAGTAAAEDQLRAVRDAVASAITAVYGEQTPSIEPCGSFLLRTTTFRSPYVSSDRFVPMDIVATMPLLACSLEELESGQYLVKRREFLGAIQKQLLKQFPGSSLIPFQQDASKDVIQVNSRRELGGEDGDRFVVCVHARPASAPARVSSAKALKKLPVYGNAVLEDFLMHSHLEKLHSMCLSSSTIVKAIVVLRCWAANRGFIGSTNPQGLSGFHIAAMVLSLVEEGIITTVMSEENIVRSFWVQVSRGHFASPEPTLVLNGEQQNILHRMTSAFFNLFVRSAAEEALQFPSAADVFTGLGHSPLHLRAGIALRVHDVPEEWFKMRESSKSPAFWAVDVDGLVKTALGQRARAICSNAERSSNSVEVYIALKDQAEARQRLTRGPAIENATAVKEFDEFWGTDRTSTRQFADGAVHRCVVWEVPTAAAQNAVLDPIVVIRTIVSAALVRHVSKAVTVTAHLEELSGVLCERVGSEWLDPVPLVETDLRRAALVVAELINNVPQGTLPCRIAAFDFISTSLRSTEPFGVRPHFSLLPRDATATAVSSLPTVEPIHAVLTIDDKHKIPDTIEAISKMKGAICAQLASVLKKESSGQRAVFATSTSVDIIRDGFLFRIYIAHYREISLLRALQRPAEANLLERKLFWAAQHAKFVQSICDGHHNFQEAARLSRRWISAMLLSDFVFPETIELLVAHSYLQASGAPSTSAEGFVRFLQLLSSHQWSLPLVLPTTEHSEAIDIFSEAQAHDGMWISAPYAPGASPFTQHTPRVMIVERLVSLASAALVTLDRSTTLKHATKDVFTHDFAAYDVVLSVADDIKQHPDRDLAILPQYEAPHEAQTYRLNELQSDQQQTNLARLVEFDPVGHLVRKLRGATRESCMLFYDNLGPSTIAAVLLSSKPSRVEIARCKAAILEQAMGGLTDASTTTGHEIPRKKRRVEPK